MTIFNKLLLLILTTICSLPAMDAPLQSVANSQVKEKKFNCQYPECPSSFAALKTLEKHIKRKHFLNKYYQCPEQTCNHRNFSLEEDFKVHMAKFHNMPNYIIPKLSESEKVELKNFVRQYMPVFSFKCDTCTASFETKQGLVNHKIHKICAHQPQDILDPITVKELIPLAKEHNGTSKEDPLRNKKRKKVDVENASDSLPESVLKCIQCEKKFASILSLKAHILGSHTDLRPYECNEKDCNFKAPSSKALKKHMLQKHLRKVKIASLAFDIQKEIAAVLAPFLSTWKFKCILCNELFPTTHSLNIHYSQPDHRPFRISSRKAPVQIDKEDLSNIQTLTQLPLFMADVPNVFEFEQATKYNGEFYEFN